MCSTCKSSHQLDHVPDVNCAPLSEVTHFGTPKLATQQLMKASSTVSDEMPARGTASNPLVLQSMAVSRYQWPTRDMVRGPTKSMCTWEKRCCGISIFSTCVAGWLVTFPFWQAVNSLHHSLMSAAKPGQTKRLLTNLVVARVGEMVHMLEDRPVVTAWYQWPDAAC